MKSHHRALARLLVAAFLSAAALSQAAPDPAFGKVELLRDEWGTANVFSDTDEGALYGLGYACAQDRLFQMSYFRLMMQGRVAEFLGDLKGKGGLSAAEQDRKMRAWGFHHAAGETFAQLDPESQNFLRAYARGVNDYIASHADDLGPLFVKYGFKPEPWTPEDSLTAWGHLANFFASDGLKDQLPDEVSTAAAARAPQAAPDARSGAGPRGREPAGRAGSSRGGPTGPGPDDSAAVVLREDVDQAWIDRVNAFLKEQGLSGAAAEAPNTGESGPKFSHAWVIGGKRMTTGSAALISDPQTPVWNPSMLYEFHIVGKTFNARGIGVAGSPVILIGFNTEVAWGMTALGADQADLFILKTDPSKPGQYEMDGEWKNMEVREETIKVKDGAASSISARATHFGPVMSGFVPRLKEGVEVSVKRMPFAAADRDTHQVAWGMMRAKSIKEFSGAIAGWLYPSANCIFGDKSGDIGYSVLGGLPIRASGTRERENTAQDGSSTASDWKGFVPYDLLPHVTNPGAGWIVSANHRPIQSFYKVPLGISTGSSGDTLRGLRIKECILEHLKGHEKFTPADVLAVQFDGSHSAKSVVVRCGFHIRDTLKGELPADVLSALKYLEGWRDRGYQSKLNIPGTELVDKIAFQFRGGQSPLTEVYGGGPDSGMARLAKTIKARLDNNPHAELTKDERDFVSMNLSSAWKAAVAEYGPDTSLWNQKAIEAEQKNVMGYMQSLDGYPSLDSAYDLPQPFLRVLDPNTIWSQRAESYTQFVPLHDTDAAQAALPIGISERPDSPFRLSQYGMWARGGLRPAPMSRAKVEEIAVQRSVLASGAAPAAPEEEKEDLASIGKKPTDPKLLELTPTIINKASSDADVDAALAEMKEHVKGDTDLTEQAIGVLRLGIYVDYGTPHAQARMGETIKALGGELPPKRPEKFIQKAKAAKEQRAKEMQGQPQGGRAASQGDGGRGGR